MISLGFDQLLRLKRLISLISLGFDQLLWTNIGFRYESSCVLATRVSPLLDPQASVAHYTWSLCRVVSVFFFISTRFTNQMTEILVATDG